MEGTAPLIGVFHRYSNTVGLLCVGDSAEMEKTMGKILCSTGAVIGKANNRDYRLLETLAKELACDGFEFLMYSTWYGEVKELTDAVEKMKLPIPVVHCEKHIGEFISKGGEENLAEAYKKFAVNCEMAERFGAERIVIHLWDGITSDANFRNNIEAYARLEESAHKHGLDLLVENVVCNRKDPMAHWCELRERYPHIHFVYDTKMAAFHGQTDLLYGNEYEWLWREGHICHYHINDYAGGHMDWKNLRALPMGSGHIDFSRFFSYIRAIGYDGSFTVEASAVNSDGTVDTDLLNRQFGFIREYTKEGQCAHDPA